MNTKSNSFVIPVQALVSQQQGKRQAANRFQGSPSHEEDVTMTQSQLSIQQEAVRMNLQPHLEQQLDRSDAWLQ